MVVYIYVCNTQKVPDCPFQDKLIDFFFLLYMGILVLVSSPATSVSLSQFFLAPGPSSCLLPLPLLGEATLAVPPGLQHLLALSWWVRPPPPPPTSPGASAPLLLPHRPELQARADVQSLRALRVGALLFGENSAPAVRRGHF